MKKKSVSLFVAVFVFSFFLSSNLQAQERRRSGLSFGIGVGLANFPSWDLSKFYKELQVVADLGLLRAGLTVGGASYRTTFSDNPMYPDVTEDVQLNMVLAHFALFPMKLKSRNSPFQIFAGVCAGTSFGNYSNGFLIGPQAGVEFFIGKAIILGFESRYIFKFGTGDYVGGYRVDGNCWNLLFNLRFRI